MAVKETLQSSVNSPVVKHSFKKVLVALDRRATSVEVMEKALTLAETLGSQLMIFHCLSEPLPSTSNVLAAGSIGIYGGSYSPEGFQQSQKLIQEERDRLLAWLNSQHQKALERGIIAEFDYKEGEPGPQICKFAENWDADLVVIGRRGRTGLSEILMGSISNYVLHHAPCTVMVVQ
ncbi:universal stress protein [Spirulina sp. CS-785/01]|uniref:universal stress protein n=1 Tax=Spirulina sp. CS-785/01 TaxID=3021716 RepID=UPI00232F9BE5|nr:universal stress protein [Spirulina sp. CS-785/01]MDB9315316.1 universal stress protein [Spirulina sp. CS-785/01]